jgi:hypothetical protein
MSWVVLLADQGGVWEGALQGAIKGAIVGAVCGALVGLVLVVKRLLQKQGTDKDAGDKPSSGEND